MSKKENLNDEDREFEKNSLGLIFTIILIATGIFMSIYFAFTSKYGFIYKGDNLQISDWLLFSGNFVGSMVGGIAAIIGVIMTVRNNQRRTAEILESNRVETQSMINNNLNTTKKLIVSNQKLEPERRRHEVLPIIILDKVFPKNVISMDDFNVIINHTDASRNYNPKDLGIKRLDSRDFIFTINPTRILFLYEMLPMQKRIAKYYPYGKMEYDKLLD